MSNNQLLKNAESPKGVIEVVAIGDIHGRENWKEIAASNPKAKIVFLGDYLDPYERLNRRAILLNLQKIIQFKIARPKRVELLMGNHDLHYITELIARGTRFDDEIEEEASRLFSDNCQLFTFAFQAGNTLFTHAGVSHEWFVKDFKGDLNRPVADQINNASKEQLKALFAIGPARNGADERGGIFWADRSELNDPLQGYTQIVGHNQVKEITELTGRRENSRIIFCDCLKQGLYYKTKVII